MHAWPAVREKKTKKQITLCLLSGQPSITFFRVLPEKQRQMMIVAVIRPAIRAAIVTNLPLSLLQNRITEDSCMIRSQTAERCVEH